MQFYITHSYYYKRIQLYYRVDDNIDTTKIAMIEDGEVIVNNTKVDIDPDIALIRYFVPYADNRYEKLVILGYCNSHLTKNSFHIVLEALGSV